MEAAASTARYAALCVAGAPGELSVVAPLAKLVCAQALTDVAAESVQLHGGIAITWEHDAHLYLKRAAGVQLTGGTPEQLRRVLAPNRWPLTPSCGAFMAIKAPHRVGQSRSMIVTLAWPPPSHIVCRP